MAKNPSPTLLDPGQLIKRAFDEANDRIRVDAEISASIGSVSIEDSDGNELEVNPDGSINVNVSAGSLQLDIDAAAGDNIAISDGTHTLEVNPDGSINVQLSATDLDIRDLQFATDKVDVTGSSVTVSATNLDVRDLDFATDKVDVTGSQVTVSATDLDIRNLQFATDSVNVTGSDVTVSNTVQVQSADLDIRDLKFDSDAVNVTGSEVTVPGVVDILTQITEVNDKLPNIGPQPQANSLSVTLASDQPAIDVNVELDAFTLSDPDSVQLVGSIDGTKTGQKFGFVNNIRLQILDAQDRIALFTYADFGTKNQRITQIDYTSATFPGSTLRRTFAYTLVGNNYRRDNETWTVV